MEDAYTTLSAKLGFPNSEGLKKVLRKLMEPDEANIVALLPASLEELSSKIGKPADRVNGLLEGLFGKGVVFMTSKGYQFARSVTQLHDATGSDRRLDRVYGQSLFDVWAEFGEKEWYPDRARKAQVQEKPTWRVLPAARVIAPQSRVLPVEDSKSILERASRLAVVHCPCRRISRNCNRPSEVCIQLNRAAEYAINRGTGRELTAKEALEVMEIAEEGGLVHSVPNSAEVSTVICNCCPDCCVLYYPLLKYGGLTRVVAKSRFQAGLDQGLCTGCQECVERCLFSAIEMAPVKGQKKLKAKVDLEKCYGCGVCAVGCGAGAIKLVEVRPENHISA